MKIITLKSNGKGIAVNLDEIVYIKELDSTNPPYTLIELKSGERLSIDNCYSSIISFLDFALEY